jgi:hypothetical protein
MHQVIKQPKYPGREEDSDLCLFLLWRLTIHLFTFTLLLLFQLWHLRLDLNFESINTITPSWRFTARTGRIVPYGLVSEFE